VTRPAGTLGPITGPTATVVGPGPNGDADTDPRATSAVVAAGATRNGPLGSAYGLAPEVSFVLEVVRPDRSGTDPALAALTRSLDWDRVVDVAAANGLAPLLARRLATLEDEGDPDPDRGADGPDLGAVSPPPAARERLAARGRTSAFTGLRLSGLLVQLVGAFDAAGVRTLPYKGPTLAARAFGDVGSREFTDLDFVVDRADLPAAVDVLLAADFEVVTETPLSAADIAAGRGIVRPPSEFLFRRVADDARVELRWWLGSAVRRLRLPFDELWARRQPVTVAGATVPTLGDDDLALVLLRHGSKHCWNRLSWLVDVAHLLAPGAGAGPATAGTDRVGEPGRIDWTTLLARADALGARRATLVGAVLAADLAGAPVPGRVLRRARADDRVVAAADAVVAEFRDRPAAFPYDTDETRKRSLDRLLVDRRRDQARTLVRQTVEPRAADVETVPLPRPLYPLYYLVHPARTVGRGLAARVGLASGAGSDAPAATDAEADADADDGAGR
jgi:hypothetical protein